MPADLDTTDINALLARERDKDLLRFITCGSVDDGKSTLIGRLLFESKALFDDQLAAVEADSRKWGTQGDAIDFALLVDGLAAEREQGITIDVAYRFFSTDTRRFIVADSPGHEQYTRNMITAASTADVAVVLVDASKGLLQQTRRHTCLVGLVGIRKLILVVNKMDRVGYAEGVFTSIAEEFRAFAGQLGISDVVSIPISALEGDNIVAASSRTAWYRGPALLACLGEIATGERRSPAGPLRFPVQWVNRTSAEFRGFAGTLASGIVQPGDRIRIQPSGRESLVSRIVTADGDLPRAVAGQSITLTLADEIDISRGDVISSADSPAEVADQFETTLAWMDDEAMLPGRPYLLKLATSTVNATVTSLKYKLNVDTLEHVAAKTLQPNEIGVCNLSLDRPLAFDAYRNSREMGGFILIDRLSNHTVGAGMIHFALRRAHNIHLQHLDINKAARAAIKRQRPAVVWLTGLSGSGKSTIANLLEKRLHAQGFHSYLLDGDNIRHGLNRDLGFTDADRVENIRRVAEVARLMVDAGLIVITAFISPFRAERAMARRLLDDGEFIEVHVDVPLDVAEQRDPKGLYRKARRGELRNFTGIDSPYEAPIEIELRIDTTTTTAEQAVDAILARLAAAR